MESQTQKMRRRIRRAIREFEHEPRVSFYRGERLVGAVPLAFDIDESKLVVRPKLPLWGSYALVHKITNIPFRVDRLGRITIYEGGV